ncbi:glycoside hydrolase family 18 protein [Botryobasidium botryosum FD-172 SS1]|uniref:Glycoside hydrolase family 18 protein n=1 Tax=Botryobasidium botryosum (strain FD-172 SS1) TaxID=930990 RepID=A0A067MYP0_BOTB1|nr:glycoside hydrolase family 18 protein [Botryobasidium botryosum FD-172 SS1]
MAAYYPDWAGSRLPPESVDFDRFHWVDFAFIEPAKDLSLNFTQDTSPDLLRRLVAAAHAKGRKVKASIGGASGSRYFSRAVSTDDYRQTFATNLATLYAEYQLDGLDLDWEYPGVATQPGNGATSDDSANYLLFLQLLRSTLPSGAVITAAVQEQPFAGADGEPLKDMSEYAKIFDWVLLMVYDVWGPSANPGPNAPLIDACGNSTQPQANAEAAVRSWTDAGFSKKQLTLGVPSYGYVSASNATSLKQRRSESETDAADISAKTESGDTDEGQVQFTSLVAQGALLKQDGKFVGSHGFQRNWDACSQTPWLRSDAHSQVITYDDPESLRLKGEFVRNSGILGANLFDAHGDTPEWDLVDAVRAGLGLNAV